MPSRHIIRVGRMLKDAAGARRLRWSNLEFSAKLVDSIYLLICASDKSAV